MKKIVIMAVSIMASGVLMAADSVRPISSRSSSSSSTVITTPECLCGMSVLRDVMPYTAGQTEEDYATKNFEWYVGKHYSTQVSAALSALNNAIPIKSLVNLVMDYHKESPELAKPLQVIVKDNVEWLYDGDNSPSSIILSSISYEHGEVFWDEVANHVKYGFTKRFCSVHLGRGDMSVQGWVSAGHDVDNGTSPCQLNYCYLIDEYQGYKYQKLAREFILTLPKTGKTVLVVSHPSNKAISCTVGDAGTVSTMVLQGAFKRKNEADERKQEKLKELKEQGQMAAEDTSPIKQIALWNIISNRIKAAITGVARYGCRRHT